MADSKPRPQHRRNASSKTNILRSLVSSKTRPVSPEPTITHAEPGSIPQKGPLLLADHSLSSTRGVLGERQGNAQSPPSSPFKNGGKDGRDGRSKTKPASPTKSKSSNNLTSVFSKMNRSSKDVAAAGRKEKDKENSSPPLSAALPDTPIWAQYSSNHFSNPRRSTERQSSRDLQEEIYRYTPREYSLHSQRNFNGSFDDPMLRPTLGTRSRPQSGVFAGGDGLREALGRRLSSGKSNGERRSEDSARKLLARPGSRSSAEKGQKPGTKTTDRTASGSSAEQSLKNEKLSINKRGGRVMAAVAALQGRAKNSVASKESKDKETQLDPEVVDAQFEAVLDSRNIPEPMRQKMRSLTMRVKSDFIKQNQDASRAEENSPPGTVNNAENIQTTTRGTETKVPTKNDEDDAKSMKRSRTRSRTFTFSRGKREDKDGSPTKKPRSQSRSRPTSIVIPGNNASRTSLAPTTPNGSLGRKSGPSAMPADYIAYLRQNQDPTRVEVGRLHKLRILLRNETVAWVDAFITQDGMSEIVSLLKRTMGLEWREDHEDQLLHETLLCLKGLCTTERAMTELNGFVDDLFPALLGMLFDDEKKGPAEYTTRTIIINMLFSYLAAATDSGPAELESRARRVLTYLGEPSKTEDARLVDFVVDMRVPRPYKLWCREVNNVTREVFWIFLHQLNVIPLPKPSSSHSSQVTMEDAERRKVLAATYTRRHFPGSRPPVPAAPYIGGVEWDATTYLTAHLDLLNGIVASIPDVAARNVLRDELQASGFEKIMGTVLRTCKEKFYSGVHDGLKAWAAAAHEDGWDTRFVREGPSEAEVIEQAMKTQRSPKKSPKKKADLPPKIGPLPSEPPKIDFGIATPDDDDGWLG